MVSKFCGNCGHPLLDLPNFCQECGSETQKPNMSLTANTIQYEQPSKLEKAGKIIVDRLFWGVLLILLIYFFFPEWHDTILKWIPFI